MLLIINDTLKEYYKSTELGYNSSPSLPRVINYIRGKKWNKLIKVAVGFIHKRLIRLFYQM